MAAYGDSAEEARRHIRRSDEARASYYKNISGLNWGDRHNYDLMVDSSIGLDESAELICSFVKERSKNA